MNQELIRPYRASDLERLLQFVGECCADPDFHGFRTGDVVHNMSNAQRGKLVEPETCFHLLEREGDLIGVIMLERPGNLAFELMTRAADAAALEPSLIPWAERQAVALCPTPPAPSAHIHTSLTTLDTARREWLEALGYEIAAKPIMACGVRSLAGPLPDFPLPDGFTIRGTTEADVVQVAAVHNGSFGSNWTVERYLRVMQTPGFDPARELVAVAPDGTFAAFVIIWFDPISKWGLFEPVGTHEAYQRRGLGKALMAEGLRRLAVGGMTQAMVNHQLAADNPAAAALYASMGFTDAYAYLNAGKPVSAINAGSP